MFGIDPLLADHIDGGVVAIVLGKVLITFALLLVSVLFMIWFERKLHADMSNRLGPNRAGPFGILQTLADGIKFFFKEDLLPDRADKRVFILAPFLSLVPAFLVFSVIPIGGVFTEEKQGAVKIFGHHTFLQLADPPIGVLLILACSSIAVYGVMLAGWSSGSKYPLLGSVRASAQMVSYEAALGLSVVSVVLLAGSLSTHDIVMSQAGDGFLGVIPRWNVVVTGLVPFIIFVIAGTAELNRPPFDLVEAEQELVGGFHTEYSSIRFALFFLAEFMNTVTMSAIIVTLFLGGPAGPTFFGPDWIWGPLWFVAKLFIFLFMFVWLRATLPRFRYDQLMDLGWKVLIPLSLGWMLLLASLNIARDRDWNTGLVVAAGFAAIVVAYVMLTAVMRTAQRRREQAELEGELDLMGYLDGFRVTFNKLFKGTQTGRTVTVPYVKDSGPKREKPERLHGRHVLNRYEDGMEKCIGCELCAGVCPARCIYVRGADNPPDDPVSPGERYGFVYEINYLRCIHCDLCVEACPTEAITETKLFEFSFTNRHDAIYTKDELLVSDDGLPQQLPWEDWSDLDAVAAQSSAWVRATAPSGDADYVGVVAWSGELGFGVKPPETGDATATSAAEADEQEPDDVDHGGHH